MSEQWLIRTTENLILGPYKKGQILHLIETGNLQPNDEVCPANGYWFFLHERAELNQAFGIEPPASWLSLAGEDDTQTQTTRSHLEQTLEFPELEEAPGEDTLVMSNRAFRQVQAQRIQRVASEDFKANTIQEKKLSSDQRIPELIAIWKVVAVLLGLLVIVLFYLVLRSLWQ